MKALRITWFVFSLVLLFAIDLVLSLMVGGELTAGAIARIFAALARALGIQVVRNDVYQLSNDPGEPGVPRRFKHSGVIVSFYAKFEEFVAFRAALNDAGIWMSNTTWEPLGVTQKYIYYSFLVNKRK